MLLKSWKSQERETVIKYTKSQASGQRGEHLCVWIYFSWSPFSIFLFPSSSLSFPLRSLVFFLLLLSSDSHLLTRSYCCRKLFISCVSLFKFLVFVCMVFSFFSCMPISYALLEPEFDRDVDLKLKHGWWMDVLFCIFMHSYTFCVRIRTFFFSIFYLFRLIVFIVDFSFLH